MASPPANRWLGPHLSIDLRPGSAFGLASKRGLCPLAPHSCGRLSAFGRIRFIACGDGVAFGHTALRAYLQSFWKDWSKHKSPPEVGGSSSLKYNYLELLKKHQCCKLSKVAHCWNARVAEGLFTFFWRIIMPRLPCSIFAPARSQNKFCLTMRLRLQAGSACARACSGFSAAVSRETLPPSPCPLKPPTSAPANSFLKRCTLGQIWRGVAPAISSTSFLALEMLFLAG